MAPLNSAVQPDANIKALWSILGAPGVNALCGAFTTLALSRPILGLQRWGASPRCENSRCPSQITGA